MAQVFGFRLNKNIKKLSRQADMKCSGTLERSGNQCSKRGRSISYKFFKYKILELSVGTVELHIICILLPDYVVVISGV